MRAIRLPHSQNNFRVNVVTASRPRPCLLAARRTQPCVAVLGLHPAAEKTISRQLIKNLLGRSAIVTVGRSHMVHFVDKHLLQRANTALLLTLVWGGVAGCAIAAMVYDVSNWIR